MPDLTWPHTEPHVSVARFKVDIPEVGTIKGIDREDAVEIAREHAGTAYRSVVLLITDGPDKGTEVLYPWVKIRPTSTVS